MRNIITWKTGDVAEGELSPLMEKVRDLSQKIGCLFRADPRDPTVAKLWPANPTIMVGCCWPALEWGLS